MYDLILKGGMVIDPAEGIHEIRDVAIKNGKVAVVAKDIPASETGKIIPVVGRLVTPGLIDIHCHTRTGLRRVELDIDEMGVYSGVTMLCDGGSAGAANFHQMRNYATGSAKTDVFCFLNLAMTGFVTVPEIWDVHDINPQLTKQVIEENRDLIKGIKLRAISALAEGMGIRAVEIAKKLATDVRLPLMLHIGDLRDRVANDIMDDFTREAVKLMEKGDIISHFMTWSAGGLILPDGTVYPELLEAKKRGVLLDSSHGINNFSVAVASYALRQGLLPNVISTDLSPISTSIVQSLLITMSKFLTLGLTIDQVVQMTSINPAKAIGEETHRGSLKPGIPADVTVLEIVQGEYIFSDGKGRGSLQGTHILEPRLVLKDGVAIPCLSRYQVPPVYTAI